MTSFEEELESMDKLWNLKEFLKEIKIGQFKYENDDELICFLLENENYGTIITLDYNKNTFIRISIHQELEGFHFDRIKYEEIEIINKLKNIIFNDEKDGIFYPKYRSIKGYPYAQTGYSYIEKNNVVDSFLIKEDTDIFNLHYYEYDDSMEMNLKSAYDVFYIMLIGLLFVYYYSEENNDIIKSLKKYYKDDKKNQKYNDILNLVSA